ncbi:MAG TPA: hypothetical protein VHM89_09685 [Acidimicrobiales bacterium]|nr:hypothetical protein [Acidimicrobiales bacterium]
MDASEVALFGFGYPAALAVITRFVPVVRERRWRWLAVHHLGVAAIIAGCVSKRTTIGVVGNSAWLVLSTVWYALGGRRRPSPAGAGA